MSVHIGSTSAGDIEILDFEIDSCTSSPVIMSTQGDDSSVRLSPRDVLEHLAENVCMDNNAADSLLGPIRVDNNEKDAGSPASILDDYDAPSGQDIGHSLSLIKIDSFLPILSILPNLQLADNFYHLRGPVVEENVKQLLEYTRTIGEFTLADKKHPNEHPIATGSIFRLFQLHSQATLTSIFPSLHHLRVIDGESSLAQFWSLFLTPSLEFLEISSISNTNTNAILSFLITLTDEAPGISSIRLGPGPIPIDSIKTCLSFVHLVELHLLNVGPTLEFSLIEEIGNLSKLEIFVLVTTSLTAYSSAAIQDRDHHAISPRAVCPPRSLFSPQPFDAAPPPVWDFHPAPPAFMDQYQDPIQTPQFSDCSHERELNMLQRSPSPSEASLQDISPRISPRIVPSDLFRDENIASEYLTQPTPKQEISSHFPRFPYLKKYHVVGSLALMEDVLGCISSATLNDISLTLININSPQPVAPPGKKGKKSRGRESLTPRLAASTLPNGTIENHESSFASLVEGTLSKWDDTLMSISIHLQSEMPSGSLPHSQPYSLSPATFEQLLSRKSLERLEISAWKLTYTPGSGALKHLLASSQSNLRILCLPIDTLEGISLNRLRAVVKACPNLVSLQCPIKHLSNVPDQLSDSWYHGLEELSVGNPLPHDDPQRLILVAQYLDALFPNLKAIKTHEGHNASQWKYIYDLIKMCQTSRSHYSVR